MTDYTQMACIQVHVISSSFVNMPLEMVQGVRHSYNGRLIANHGTPVESINDADTVKSNSFCRLVKNEFTSDAT